MEHPGPEGRPSPPPVPKPPIIPTEPDLRRTGVARLVPPPLPGRERRPEIFDNPPPGLGSRTDWRFPVLSCSLGTLLFTLVFTLLHAGIFEKSFVDSLYWGCPLGFLAGLAFGAAFAARISKRALCSVTVPVGDREDFALWLATDLASMGYFESKRGADWILFRWSLGSGLREQIVAVSFSGGEAVLIGPSGDLKKLLPLLPKP